MNYELATRNANTPVRRQSPVESLLNWDPWDWFFPRPNVNERERFSFDMKEDRVVITGELAGYKPEDITVDYQDGTITVATRVETETENGTSSRSFAYRLRVAQDVDVDKATATMQDGLLTIEMPLVIPEKKNIMITTS